MSDSPRPSSQPNFWDVRYDRARHLFGAEPNAFVQEEAHRLPTGSEVVELGAGEGHTMAWLAWKHGHHVTAVDFSETALAYGPRVGRRPRLVVRGRPGRRAHLATRSAVERGRRVVTFLQLLPDECQQLYDLLKNIVRPGG